MDFGEHLGPKPFLVFPPTKEHLSFGNNAQTCIFRKLLPRPSHSARYIRLEIMCRTPVSKSRHLSYESKSNLKAPKIVVWPECQPEFPGRAKILTSSVTLLFASTYCLTSMSRHQVQQAMSDAGCVNDRNDSLDDLGVPKCVHFDSIWPWIDLSTLLSEECRT